jgi:hypothetical protein
MERLVTTSQAATILNLSLQGIHYRIKNNQLRAIKKDNKTYVYIPKELQEEANDTKISSEKSNLEDNFSINRVVEAKNEQISLLKDSMLWMKNQYKEEINRIEKNQKKITKVFNHEITLLQNAFNEMRSIYKSQNKTLTSINKVENNEKPNLDEKVEFITLKDFFIRMKKYNKTDLQIKQIILHRIKLKDTRFILDKVLQKIMIKDEEYLDLI